MSAKCEVLMAVVLFPLWPWQPRLRHYIGVYMHLVLLQ